MAYQDELAELRAWGYEQNRNGSRIMDPTSMRMLLDGFFHRFKLVPSASQLEFKTDKISGEQYWLFVGFLPWWDEPGLPTMPESDLRHANLHRMRRILKNVLQTASRRDELARVTALRGRDLDAVLAAVGA